MEIKVVALGGEPATGKSTLMSRLIEVLEQNGSPVAVKEGLVEGQLYAESRVLILGKYEEGETFGGTDRLSMAVSPKAMAFLDDPSILLEDDGKPWTIVFEGDRLFTETFIYAGIVPKASEHRIFLLKASHEEKHRRHEERGDTQTEKFLRSRKTKYDRLAQMMGLDPSLNFHCLENDTLEQADENFELFKGAVLGD